MGERHPEVPALCTWPREGGRSAWLPRSSRQPEELTRPPSWCAGPPAEQILSLSGLGFSSAESHDRQASLLHSHITLASVFHEPRLQEPSSRYDEVMSPQGAAVPRRLNSNGAGVGLTVLLGHSKVNMSQPYSL